MTEKAILEALQKAVTAAVAASDDATLVVKYLGRNFKKPDGSTSWLEIVHIPNNVTDEFWSDGKTYRGMMRLVLHYPMKDKGAYEAIELIESIAEYFTKGRRLSDLASTVSVKVADHPNLMGIIEEPPEMLLPISIRYEFFTA